MRAHTTTTTTSPPRRKARHGCLALALALGVCGLAIPATANAQPIDSDPSSVNAITGGSNDSSQPVGGSDYSSVNSITPPASSPSGSGESGDVSAGYSSVNAITGAPSDTPTFASGSPSGSDDGFDWPSALVGAGAALALTALGSAALLTVRRRSATPSPSTG